MKGRKRQKAAKVGKKRPNKFLLFLRSVFSGILMTISLFLILLAVGELMVHFLDMSIGNDNYTDWMPVPLVLILCSVPFLILYTLINYDRIGWIQKLLTRLRSRRSPKEIETIELD
ncbi:MAG: hypothetical protein ACMUIE_06235 [Thermoplasmatota archaeon]